MLLGMLGDVPEMFEDIAAWAPKTHAEHFRDSSFSDRDVAIAAHEMAPARYRVPFDDTTAQENEVVRRAVVAIAHAIENDDTARAAMLGENASRVLQKLIDVASGIIHGSEKGMSQAEVDIFIDEP